MPAVMFIHGQESSSQTYKATLLRAAYSSALVPDFSGPLDERMAQLAPLLAQANDWVLIGSSMGGLMAALWAYAHPAQVRRLVLLAPALNAPEFTSQLGAPIAVPTVVYHGVRDTVVPLAPVRAVAERAFTNLAFHEVDDDHRLHATATTIDWRALVAG